MGTRCITEVRSKWEGKEEWQTHVVVYRQWDGYLKGHGQWLFDFLKDLVVVNGIGGDTPQRFANGPGRLAAMLVTELQRDGHDPDLRPNTGAIGQEYHYRIDIIIGAGGGIVNIIIFDGPMTAFGMGGEDCIDKIFEGTVAEYGKFLEAYTK